MTLHIDRHHAVPVSCINRSKALSLHSSDIAVHRICDVECRMKGATNCKSPDTAKRLIIANSAPAVPSVVPSVFAANANWSRLCRRILVLPHTRRHMHWHQSGEVKQITVLWEYVLLPI